MPGDTEQERSDAFWLSSVVLMGFRTFVDLEGVYYHSKSPQVQADVECHLQSAKVKSIRTKSAADLDS